MAGEGLKFDEEKLRYDLLPVECIEDVVKVLSMGAGKYGPDNWQRVEPFNDRYYAALMRHIVEWRKGNVVDEESGLSHLSHAMCNIVFLLWNEKQKMEEKDFFTPYIYRYNLGEKADMEGDKFVVYHKGEKMLVTQKTIEFSSDNKLGINEFMEFIKGTAGIVGYNGKFK